VNFDGPACPDRDVPHQRKPKPGPHTPRLGRERGCAPRDYFFNGSD
jgi:hypothetical protein